MDDFLEQPVAFSANNGTTQPPEDTGLSSADDDDDDDDDGGLDWTKLPTTTTTSSRPVIPKRGDKDFEPSIQGGSGLQRHVLDRARRAMFDALRAERNTSSKSVSYGVWYPALARTHVTTVRGIHYTTMGHSVARSPSFSVPSSSVPPPQGQKMAKRVELLPEEAIYLVERGSMFCWKGVEGVGPKGGGRDAKAVSEDAETELEMEGAPMSVQQVFAEMIGTEGLSLEKYQVFAYLKRLGYVVMRTKAPSLAYLTATPYSTPPAPSPNILARISRPFMSAVRSVLRIFSRTASWWTPALFHHGFSHSGIFRSLRFLPAGHSVPLHVELSASEEPSPYEIFFNVYKPATPFKKTAPPKPDFQVVVVNARTTPMPTLTELTDLFDVLPELPPPVPRKRLSYADQKKQTQVKSPPGAATASFGQPPPPSLSSSSPAQQPPQPHLHLQDHIQRFLSWIFLRPPSTTSSTTPAKAPERKPNPFAVLKQGKKMVVVAAVDAGSISFFSFRQGGFEEFPMA